ncbi:MAG: fibronectin type III domain-containing protein [Caldilineaceae bacterium]|nr:fibronectin type III domain-containing protein [Caldilineaceae bacterium]
MAAGKPDHYYTVAAVDSAGVYGEWSNQVRITAPDKLPAPLLVATASSATTIELSWSEMIGAARFELFSWWANDPGWQLLDDSLDRASYTHGGLTPGWTYYYAIRAIGSNGLEGEWSNTPHAAVPYVQAPTASPTASPTPTTTPTPSLSLAPTSTPTATPIVTSRLPAPTLTITETLTTSFELSWTYDSRADRYELLTWWAPLPAWQTVDSNLKETSFVHLGLVPGRTYYYAIRAVDSQGVGGEWSAFPSATVPTATQMTEAAQREALVALYHATGGANWTQSNNWLTSEPISTWYGVTVDPNGRVTELLLTGNNLRGSLPNLDALDGLTILSLGSNFLSGSIPELNALTGLSFLDLSFNQFTGSIPQLNALTGLEWLSLNNNQVTGTLPDLSALNRLTSLSLGSNDFSGSIPDLSSLTNLRELYLTDSNLSGSIPDLKALTELTHLYLGDNRLSGSFPDIVSLNHLTWVDLSQNLLEGQLPDLSALANLTWLSLSRNQFSGQIPDLTALTQLNVLQLGHNRLTGPVPNLSPLESLIVLDLAGNELCLTGGLVQSDTSTAVAIHLADLNLPDCSNVLIPSEIVGGPLVLTKAGENRRMN